MTLDNIIERLRIVGKPLNEKQMNALKKFAERRSSKGTFYHEPIKSRLFYVEAAVEDNRCYILHPNGDIDHTWDECESESNAFGMMVWFVGDEPNIMIAYY
ncbi:MAG: hypothetical protein J5881_02420 [Clostridia bacterium]|nr:hypothetical protein [Clostridia bacterium]